MKVNQETSQIVDRICESCGQLVGYEDLDPYIPKFLQSVDKMIHDLNREVVFSLPYLEQKAKVAELLVKKVRG